MVEALKLGGDSESGPRIRRLNRLPIAVTIGLLVVFLGVIVYGLSSRGLRFGGGQEDREIVRPASSDADQLKQGIPDGIIGEPAPVVSQPSPGQVNPPVSPFSTANPTSAPEQPSLVIDETWRERLEREQQEQALRELHRQRMARLQAEGAALDAPIGVDLKTRNEGHLHGNFEPSGPHQGAQTYPPNAREAYAAAMLDADRSNQATKERFFNQDIAELGYLPNSVIPQRSPFELKRGSVIPATLMTGINSDLPGRIAAQVSQNVYDSATGRHLLIPQGTKLFGRYDSNIAFGQDRVLVVWTDLIFQNGSTLQIGGMAGVDTAGYGGFADEVDNNYLSTFGSAILVALIGAGTEMIIPQERNGIGAGHNVSDATRRSFAETFGQMSEQTLTRNLNVQPTLQIRPGYLFNVLVDQDLIFPAPSA